MSECEQGYQGFCCCNCSNRLEVVKHPWNEEPFKGFMSESFGFVCIGLANEGKAVFSDRAHGMCEMHSVR
jgi:hypothetical protein